MHEHDLYDCAATKVKLGKRPTLSQETITFPTMSKAQHDALDEDFAAVCYEEGLPFSLFESPAMKRALRRLNPSYKPPNHYSTLKRLVVLCGKLWVRFPTKLKTTWPPPRQSLFQHERQS